ncbi:MAG TPA: hypothetical protein VF939_12110 [Puia sp.]
MTPSIELHIEELVLTDIPARDTHRLEAAIRQKLTRLLLQQGLPPALKKEVGWPELRTGPIDLSRHRSPESLGNGLARSIFSAFKRDPE